MVEYVYALHDFQPEHEDEVPFRAGERIEIIEKDEMYGDGWWQVSSSAMNGSTALRAGGHCSSIVSVNAILTR
jgi:hypothetical protein